MKGWFETIRFTACIVIAFGVFAVSTTIALADLEITPDGGETGAQCYDANCINKLRRSCTLCCAANCAGGQREINCGICCSLPRNKSCVPGSQESD